MQHPPAPLGSAIRFALDAVADRYPTCADEVIRRRTIAVLAWHNLSLVDIAKACGVAHSHITRKLASPDVAATGRRALDWGTLVQILDAVATLRPTSLLMERGHRVLISLEHEPEDVAVLHWLSAAATELRAGGAKRAVVDALLLPVADARARWPDADARIGRLLRLGFVGLHDADGAPSQVSALTTSSQLSLTPTGRACALR